MKKDIYLITNIINNKQYVGQSVDYLYRFRKHKEASKRPYSYQSALYNAMNKYGVENFVVSLLESQVENYNEREQYWINKLETLRPKGYNITSGGAWYPNLSGIQHHSATISSQEDLDFIYDMLLNSNETETEIAKKIGTSQANISNINLGKCYVQPGFDFPLRSFHLEKGKLDRLTYDLKYSNYSYSELSKIYNLSIPQIKAICYGKSWFRDYLKYPLRQENNHLKQNEITMIQKDLLSTSLTYSELAKKYNCSKNTIIRINEGTKDKNENYKYPLRKTSILNQKDLNTIHSLLENSNLSIEKIAKQFSVSSSTIKRINNGATKKYFDSSLNYPLRKK